MERIVDAGIYVEERTNLEVAIYGSLFFPPSGVSKKTTFQQSTTVRLGIPSWQPYYSGLEV